MKPTRTTVGLVVLLAILAGCGSGGSSTPVAASGSPATIGAEAVEAAGYEHRRTANQTLNTTVSVTVEGDIEAQESQDVIATIPVAVYRRSTAAGPAIVAVAASPSVQVLENPPMSADPLASLSTGELVTFVQSTYDEPTDLQERGARDVRLLGEDTDLVTHRGRSGDDERQIAVGVARVESGDDVVTVVAVYPAAVDEGRRIATLVEGVDH